jgi:hypothetical protein
LGDPIFTLTNMSLQPSWHVRYLIGRKNARGSEQGGDDDKEAEYVRTVEF